LIIREFKPSDRLDCIEIFKGNMPKFFAPAELPDFVSCLDNLDSGKKLFKNALNEKYFVAVLSNKIVACGGYYIVEDENRGNMVWGMVDNTFHKMGIGRKLLEYRIQEIKKLNPENTVSLDTTQYSYQFFEKLGFTTTNITKDFYGEGLDRYDMINH